MAVAVAAAEVHHHSFTHTGSGSGSSSGSASGCGSGSGSAETSVKCESNRVRRVCLTPHSCSNRANSSSPEDVGVSCCCPSATHTDAVRRSGCAPSLLSSLVVASTHKACHSPSRALTGAPSASRSPPVSLAQSEAFAQSPIVALGLACKKGLRPSFKLSYLRLQSLDFWD